MLAFVKFCAATIAGTDHTAVAKRTTSDTTHARRQNYRTTWGSQEPRQLELGTARRSREGDGVPDVLHAGDVAHKPLEAQAVAGVRHASVPATAPSQQNQQHQNNVRLEHGTSPATRPAWGVSCVRKHARSIKSAKSRFLLACLPLFVGVCAGARLVLVSEQMLPASETVPISAQHLQSSLLLYCCALCTCTDGLTD